MKAKRMKQKESKSQSKNNRKANKNIEPKKIVKIKKVIVAFLLLIFIICIGFFFIYNNSNNEEDPLLSEKDVFGMELKNISIEEQNGVYVFKAQLKNTLNEKFESKPVQIIFRDEKNQKVIKYQYTINNLEKGQTQDIQIKTSEPINEFYTFDVEHD